jgi:hypothetical protein
VSFNNGKTFTFTGIWLPDPRGAPEPLWNPGFGSTHYHWTCAAVTPAAPSSGTQFSSGGKTLGDDILDASGTYFTSIFGHSGASNGGPAIYSTSGHSSGTKGYYYYTGGVFICTWGSSLSGSQHWNVNATHTSGESGSQYKRACV